MSFFGPDLVEALNASVENCPPKFAEPLPSSGLEPQAPDDVADAILALIRSGAERADLVPVELGGTLQA